MNLHFRHIRSANICISGARKWFAQRGWSWAEFVTNGRPLEDFIATGCPLAARAVAEAHKETADGR